MMKRKKYVKCEAIVEYDFWFIAENQLAMQSYEDVKSNKCKKTPSKLIAWYMFRDSICYLSYIIYGLQQML